MQVDGSEQEYMWNQSRQRWWKNPEKGQGQLTDEQIKVKMLETAKVVQAPEEEYLK